MDITVQNVLQILIGSSLVSGLVLWWLNRPKQKREIAALLGQSYSVMFKDQKEHITYLEKRIDNHEEITKHNQSQIKALKRASEECRYQHQVTELEMIQVKRLNNFLNVRREMVYVIDDDEDVLKEFEEKFSKISVLDYKGFLKLKDFLDDVRHARPPIVVMDYRLDGGRTAEDIISELGYVPAIFIMSNERGYEKRFYGKDIQFFVKNDFYIYKISSAILKYLTDKQ